MSVASANKERRGWLPAMPRVAFALHVSVPTATGIVQKLKDRELIDPDGKMHDWEVWNPPSDDSAPRVRRARAGPEPPLTHQSVSSESDLSGKSIELTDQQTQQDSEKCNGDVTALDIDIDTDTERDTDSEKETPLSGGKIGRAHV